VTKPLFVEFPGAVHACPQSDNGYANANDWCPLCPFCRGTCASNYGNHLLCGATYCPERPRLSLQLVTAAAAGPAEIELYRKTDDEAKIFVYDGKQIGERSSIMQWPGDIRGLKSFLETWEGSFWFVRSINGKSLGEDDS